MTKKILHIIPHKKIYPPLGGGMLRCYNIMLQLSQNFELDVLSYQPGFEFNSANLKVNRINFYTPEFNVKKKEGIQLIPKKLKNAIKYRWLRRSIKGPAQSVVIDFEPVLKILCKSNNYQIVLVEHLQTMTISPIIKRLWPKTKIILNAHNIDHKLILEGQYKEKIKKIESSLYKHVNSFIACSENDLEELTILNKNKISGGLIPNGVTIHDSNYEPNKAAIEKKLLFCGSLNYEPNKTGLLWFFKKIWPLLITEIPDIQLTIIGYGEIKHYEELKNDLRINIIGKVDNVTEYYHKNNIAITPLLSGSGTRLKILEAMSFGNPVVTTPIGIEGIKAKDMEHALIAETPMDFAKKIILLINNPDVSNKITHQAFKLVKENYDWNIVGNMLNSYINNLK